MGDRKSGSGLARLSPLAVAGLGWSFALPLPLTGEAGDLGHDGGRFLDAVEDEVGEDAKEEDGQRSGQVRNDDFRREAKSMIFVSSPGSFQYMAATTRR